MTESGHGPHHPPVAVSDPPHLCSNALVSSSYHQLALALVSPGGGAIALVPILLLINI